LPIDEDENDQYVSPEKPKKSNKEFENSKGSKESHVKK
jgi:hypothetical protein